MKKIFFIPVFMSGLFLVQCGSSGQLLSSPPQGVADRETVAEYLLNDSGEKEVRVSVPGGASDSGISLDSMYYRGQRSALRKVQKDSYTVYIADFPVVKTDRILHSDPRKEFGNSPIPTPTKLPFDLKEDEAVVRYTEKGKEKYFKISEIRMVKPESN